MSEFNGRANSPPTWTEMVAGIADDARTLITQQFKLLQAEMRENIQRVSRQIVWARMGWGLITVGVLCLVISAVFVLTTVWPELPLWGAWLIGGAVSSALGTIIVWSNQRQVASMSLRPDRSMNALLENVRCLLRVRS